MLRPSAPDSSEKTSSFGINRRPLLDAALCTGILLSGIACFETGRKIRNIFEEKQPKTVRIVPAEDAMDRDAREFGEKPDRSLPVETMHDGESLLNRPLSCAYTDDLQAECFVDFRLLRNEDGLFLEVEGETYVCDQTIMWVKVYKEIETAVIGCDKKSDARLVEWGSPVYGNTATPLSDITRSVRMIKESEAAKITVPTSIGSLTFKKMPKTIDSLAQITH